MIVKHSTMLLLVLALALILPVTCGWAESAVPTVKAFYAQEGPVIDGAFEDTWNLSSPIVIDQLSQAVRDGTNWQGPEDVSAEVYLAWDSENLYLAAKVKEDNPFGAIEMLPIDGVDNFQIYLSTNPQDDPNRAEYSSTDFKVFIIMDGKYYDTAIDRRMVADIQRFVSKGLDGGENVLEGFECAAVKDIDGFTLEAKIPFACFSNNRIPQYVPAAGDTVKFDFLITDIGYPCPGIQYIPQLAWTGSIDINDNPSLWGNLEFVE